MVQVSDDLEPATVDIRVERPIWEAVRPSAGPVTARIAFVDGVRRIERRLVVTEGERSYFGLLGSYGVGAVSVDSAARVGHELIGRVLVTGGGFKPRPFDAPVDDGRSDAALRARDRARERPGDPGRRLADGDAPERGRPRRAALGRGGRRLPGRAADVPHRGRPRRGRRLREAPAPHLPRSVRRTPSCPGWRSASVRPSSSSPAATRATPGSCGSPRRAIDSELAGLVRLEVSAARGPDAARRLADATARLLPRFAPRRGARPARAAEPASRSARSSRTCVARWATPRLIRREIGARLARRWPPEHARASSSAASTRRRSSSGSASTRASSVQLDDMVVARCAARRGPDGARTSASTASSTGAKEATRARSSTRDAFRASAGTLPVDVSYAAHVQVTRIDPEVFVPPHPGRRGRRRGEDSPARALLRPDGAPGGGRRHARRRADLRQPEFLDGTRGAHVSISGVSGVATKTSYATFLLYSLFHCEALGSDALNSRAIVFNVKGEDLLWLDRDNVRLSNEAGARQYARLGLPASPSRASRSTRRSEGPATCRFPTPAAARTACCPYVWTLRDFARDRLLRFAVRRGRRPASPALAS